MSDDYGEDASTPETTVEESSPPQRPASRRAAGGGRRSGGRVPARGGRGAPREPKRRRRGWLAALVLVLLVLVGGASAVYFALFAPVVQAAPGQPVQIEIPKGATTSAIADLLANSGVIVNPLKFRLELKMSADTAPLKAGVYDLATGMSDQAATTALRAGPPIQYFTLAIPEGWTIPQIAKRVEEKAGVPAAEFEKLASTGSAQFSYQFLADNKTGSLQGYLFPKTYRVKIGSGVHEIIDTMLRQFAKETAGLDMSYGASRNLNTHDVVTIASIIEREARVDTDRPLISSVIYNRLSKGMLLEICATVQFIVGNKPRLLYSDLRVESPYNTYLHKGLPPGPISSPGLASLQAAATPANTDFLFYVLTHKDGSHSFSRTLQEHLRYKAQAAKGLK